jgi:uncharacterized Zn-binding protein involved in type VI secretion
MSGLARVGDKAMAESDSHGCPACPHTVIGPALTGSPTVMINHKPALRLGDAGVHAACCGSNDWQVVGGSQSVFIDGLPAARIGDATQHCGAMGRLVEGSEDIVAGD